MGFGSNTASGLRSSYLHLCIRYYGKCAGIWDILYVGVFSHDMGRRSAGMDTQTAQHRAKQPTGAKADAYRIRGKVSKGGNR